MDIFKMSKNENTRRLGYVDGITNIILNNLKTLKIHERPLHCSDQKREVIYIKDNNAWTKEDEDKPILTKAIKVIANENIKNIYNEVKNGEKNILIVLTMILKKIVFTS